MKLSDSARSCRFPPFTLQTALEKVQFLDGSLSWRRAISSAFKTIHFNSRLLEQSHARMLPPQPAWHRVCFIGLNVDFTSVVSTNGIGKSLLPLCIRVTQNVEKLRSFPHHSLVRFPTSWCLCGQSAEVQCRACTLHVHTMMSLKWHCHSVLLQS